MKIDIYGSHKWHNDGYSAEELKKGMHWATTDVTCPWCGKVQPIMGTSYVGGPCCRCGKLTSGAGSR